MNMTMSAHAIERWEERCFGLSIESEWIQASRMDKKTLMGLKETSPAHKELIRNDHDEYFYLVSKQSLTVWVCKQQGKGEPHRVVTVWRLGYSKERARKPIPSGWLIEPWHDVVTKSSGWRFRSKQTGWASNLCPKFNCALKSLHNHIRQAES